MQLSSGRPTTGRRSAYLRSDVARARRARGTAVRLVLQSGPPVRLRTTCLRTWRRPSVVVRNYVETEPAHSPIRRPPWPCAEVRCLRRGRPASCSDLPGWPLRALLPPGPDQTTDQRTPTMTTNQTRKPWSGSWSPDHGARPSPIQRMTRSASRGHPVRRTAASSDARTTTRPSIVMAGCAVQPKEEVADAAWRTYRALRNCAVASGVQCAGPSAIACAAFVCWCAARRAPTSRCCGTHWFACASRPQGAREERAGCVPAWLATAAWGNQVVTGASGRPRPQGRPRQSAVQVLGS